MLNTVQLRKYSYAMVHSIFVQLVVGKVSNESAHCAACFVVTDCFLKIGTWADDLKENRIF